MTIEEALARRDRMNALQPVKGTPYITVDIAIDELDALLKDIEPIAIEGEMPDKAYYLVDVLTNCWMQYHITRGEDRVFKLEPMTKEDPRAKGVLLNTVGFDPNRIWGEGNWVRHENCPVALDAGQSFATHSKGFHGRPLRAAK